MKVWERILTFVHRRCSEGLDPSQKLMGFETNETLNPWAFCNIITLALNSGHLRTIAKLAGQGRGSENCREPVTC